MSRNLLFNPFPTQYIAPSCDELSAFKAVVPPGGLTDEEWEAFREAPGYKGVRRAYEQLFNESHSLVVVPQPNKAILVTGASIRPVAQRESPRPFNDVRFSSTSLPPYNVMAGVVTSVDDVVGLVLQDQSVVDALRTPVLQELSPNEQEALAQSLTSTMVRVLQILSSRDAAYCNAAQKQPSYAPSSSEPVERIAENLRDTAFSDNRFQIQFF